MLVPNPEDSLQSVLVLHPMLCGPRSDFLVAAA